MITAQPKATTSLLNKRSGGREQQQQQQQGQHSEVVSSFLLYEATATSSSTAAATTTSSISKEPIANDHEDYANFAEQFAKIPPKIEAFAKNVWETVTACVVSFDLTLNLRLYEYVDCRIIL